MTRRLIALGLAAIALAGPAAQAAPARAVRPQVVDPKGDSQAGSLDVLSATLSSPSGTTLLAKLVLAEAPAAAPADYIVSFWVDCTSYSLRLRWAGSAAPVTEGTLGSTKCASTTSGELSNATVAYRIEGAAITFEMPFGTGLRVGTKLTSIAAAALVGGVYAGSSDPVTGYHEAAVGDVGFGNKAFYVVGSERARRR